MSQSSKGQASSLESEKKLREILQRAIQDLDVLEQQRHLAESQAEEADSKLKAILEGAVDSIITINERGCIESVNPAACEMFGYRAEELAGKNVKCLMPEPYQSRHDQYLHHYHETHERKIIGIGREVEAKRRNGDVFPIELSISEIRSGGRRFYTGIIRDISERKQVERELVEKEARLASVFENAVDGIITISATGRVESVNPAAEQLFGYSADELKGQNVKRLMPNPYHEQHDQYLRNYAESGDPKVIGKGREVTGLRKDGSTFPLELSVSEIRAGDLHLFVGITRDITARREAENEREIHRRQLEDQVQQRTAELENANHALSTSNRQLEEFAYVVSHDLKSPLRGIATVAHWLRSDYSEKLDDEGLELLSLLEQRVTRAENLIAGILNYSRFTRDQFDERDVALEQVLDDAIEDLNLPDKVVINRNSKFPTVRGKAVPLQQVFLNLISNGVKYNHSDPPIIDLSCLLEDGYWHIVVRDNGIGVAPEYHDRIFEVFQTLHARDDIDSSGIGLAVVREIVKSHGGRIWVESQEGAGSIFHVLLPANKETSNE